jgi:hypothetical protein
MQDTSTLRTLFRAELDAETRRNAWELKERVLWIMEHLDEYIDQWLGFAALRISSEALIESDLFTVVEIAAEALEQEFAGTGTPLETYHLESMREAVEALRKTGDRNYAITVKEVMGELKSSSPRLNAVPQ